jgi:hypothetical protein
MSSPHPYTSGIVPSIHQLDEEDDDICPICEGACTCNNKSTVPTSVPFSSTSRQTHNRTFPDVPPSSTPHTHPATSASLKIKLTIPATLLTRSHPPTLKGPAPPSKKQNKSIDIHSRTKRQTCPPKAGIRTPIQPRVTDKKVSKPKSAVKDTTGKSLESPQTRVGGSDDYHARSGTDGASARRSHDVGAGSTVTAYGQFIQNQDFPTFISADEFSSANESSAGSSSSSEESELTDFSDSSVAEEEENFIRATEEQRARARDKARLRRELLGEVEKRKERRNDWEIRSRKKSVSPSDNDMDIDSDESDDEAEEAAEAAEGDDGEDDEEDDTGPARGSYIGIATGWSDGEESSFDADLFFAGLSDSDSGPEFPTIPGPEAAPLIQDNSSVTVAPSSLAQGIFEITEGWDGSVIFTNGLQDGQGLLDRDFEANAAQLLIDAATVSGSNSGSDIRMSESAGEMGDSEDENDTPGEMENNDGDTTEEELVDDRGLPTYRAMRLFRPPVTPLFSINPLSTMSPGPRVRDVIANQSPQPSDILAGRVFGYEDEDPPEPPMSEISSTIFSASSDRGTPRFPLMGIFETSSAGSLRRAVIDGSRPVVPSPFRKSRRRPSESVSARSISKVRLRSWASIPVPALTRCTEPRQICLPVSCILCTITPALCTAKPL